MSDVIELTQQLIKIPSISPNDANCQDILIERLEKLDFKITRLPAGKVSNFFARRGTQSPLFIFAGHTDVVPPGDFAEWASAPFEPEIRDNYLYGRGVADMKGSLAAMIIACERFIEETPQHTGSIGFIITSGEEGDDFLDGTPKVIEYLQQQNEEITYCLLGEPTCHNQLGDTIKVGRRGSLTGKLIIHGKQGHVAYPHLANNPIHTAAMVLSDLTHVEWGQGNQYFPPTSLQCTNIHAGTGAGNVIPGKIEISFNFRYSSARTADDLKEQVSELVEKHTDNYKLEWRLNGEPFLTKNGEITSIVQTAIKTVTGVGSQLSTTGGTSDGRFIAPTGTEIIEFGPSNGTIHKTDEHIALDELEQLVEIYFHVLKQAV